MPGAWIPSSNDLECAAGPHARYEDTKNNFTPEERGTLASLEILHTLTLPQGRQKLVFANRAATVPSSSDLDQIHIMHPSARHTQQWTQESERERAARFLPHWPEEKKAVIDVVDTHIQARWARVVERRAQLYAHIMYQLQRLRRRGVRGAGSSKHKPWLLGEDGELVLSETRFVRQWSQAALKGSSLRNPWTTKTQAGEGRNGPGLSILGSWGGPPSLIKGRLLSGPRGPFAALASSTNHSEVPVSVESKAGPERTDTSIRRARDWLYMRPVRGPPRTRCKNEDEENSPPSVASGPRRSARGLKREA
ncbi:hypothetical protein C8F04DRAFT_1195178 [Mycena alexandri]|uniref:Uncharacterized protein n=1 Tax=Mycena alexandri TaxID=1745969 RepID=A0AAD6S6V3_9AGAR|nr:hypothetical protein C8F04DRAFT_1195178 [Mycena alexandri]